MVYDVIKRLQLAIFGATSPNELALDQSTVDGETPEWDDPTMLRQGAYKPTGRLSYYLGLLTWDRLTDGMRGHPRRSRLISIAAKVDPVPALEFWLQPSDRTDEDGTMRLAARITAAGIENLPIQTPPAAPFKLVAPGGETSLELQGDGHLVLYDVRPGLTINGQPVNGVALRIFEGKVLTPMRPDGRY